MTQRVTAKQLDQLAEFINNLAGSNGQPTGYRISKAYGGFNLVQTTEGGAERDVIVSYHMPARELDGLIRAYMQGHFDCTCGRRFYSGERVA